MDTRDDVLAAPAALYDNGDAGPRPGGPDDDWIVLRLADGLDEAAAQRLRTEVRDRDSDRLRNRSLVVDLCDAGAVSHRFVEALLAAVHRCREAGRLVVIRGASNRVAASLRAVGLHRYAAIIPSAGTSGSVTVRVSVSPAA